VSGGLLRPDRQALLELDELLHELEQLATAGGRARYDADAHYRWVIHRLWIAVGNEADAYATAVGDRHAQPWYSLVLLRNRLAHVRLPDIDEDEVWRMTTLRPGSLSKQVRGLLR